MRVVPPRYREELVHDLEEGWDERRRRQGLYGAQWWYWRTVLRVMAASWWQVGQHGDRMRPPDEPGDGWLFTLVYDVRQTLRTLLRSPGFAATAASTLAIGIGASTVVFSLAHAVLLRAIPFQDPDMLVQVDSIRSGERGKVSIRDLEDLRERWTAAAAIAAYVPGSQYSLTGGAAPEKAAAILASHNLLEVLGIPLLAGEPFESTFDRERHNALILSHGLWQRQFGGDPAIVGRTIEVDATPGVATPHYTVVGIAPPGSEFPARTDLYRSLFINERFPDRARRNARNAVGIVRLRSDASVARASEEIAVVARDLARTFPATNDGLSFVVTPLADVYAGAVRPYVWLLVGAVVTILLIASVNVSNLFLSRAIDREPELAVRRALGATGGRLVRQWSIEGLIVALAGGAAGAALAYASLQWLMPLIRLDLPTWMTPQMGPIEMLFVVGLSAAAGLLGSALPAIRTMLGEGFDALRQGSTRTIGSQGQGRLRRILLIAEVAIAALLLVSAGLMLQTFRSLARVDVGFEPSGLLTFKVALPVYYAPDATRQFQDELLTRLAALPGATGAALNANLPLAQVGQADRQSVVVEGQDSTAIAANPYVNYQRVSDTYFEVMRIPLAAGRWFDRRDGADAQRVALVSRRVADRFWPEQDAIGRRVRTADPNSPWHIVVGVVGDVRHTSVANPPGYDIYLPATQAPPVWSHVVLRVAGRDPMTAAEPARQAVWAINRFQPVTEMQPMSERALDTAWQQRAVAVVLATFSGVALVLAAVGIYSVTAYTVGQRRREFGVRRAIGAQQADLAWVVLRDVGRSALVGLAIGLAFAVVGLRAVRPLLFGVASVDPWSFGLAPLLLLLVTVAAALGPARRAAATDPLVSLKGD